MNHKLYKIKTKIQQKIPLHNGKQLKVSTETKTVTPNKDMVGEKREELRSRTEVGWGVNVIHSGGVDDLGIITQ